MKTGRLALIGAIGVVMSVGATVARGQDDVDAIIEELEEALYGASDDVMAAALRRELRDLIPTTDADYPVDSAAKIALGQALFFDKILSGNMNISCATCHHPNAATGDGLSLPVGEGGMGLGLARDTGHGDDAVHERVPRNAPHVFNLGSSRFNVMFHDGRVEVDASQPRGFRSPAGGSLPAGLDNVLAVQAMFPVTSATEMAGQAGENSIADAAAMSDLTSVWEQLADRLAAIPEYVDMFRDAYPGDVNIAGDITYVHAANAIAAFENDAWRSDNSRFDRWLRDEKGTLSKNEIRGMRLFFGKANCASCHSGVFQTDEQYYAIGMPQVGPGKGDNAPGFSDGHDDFGRERVTGDSADRYRFRTPSLRNVVITAPYGHSGAYDDLESVIRHHLDPINSLFDYDAAAQMRVPSRDDLDAIDVACMSDFGRVIEIASRVEIRPVELTDQQIGWIIDFLGTLTDPRMLDLRRDLPRSVPSGLPLFE